MRTGTVVKEQAASWVGAAADGSTRTFDEEFSSGAGKGGQEPVEATLAGHKLEGPGTFVGHEFVVTFGDA